MAEKLTFHQLVTNPAGKGSAQIAMRGAILNDLRNRTTAVMNMNKGIDLTVYKTKTGIFVLFFRFRSEHLKQRTDMYYDTIIELTPPAGSTGSEKTIGEYTCRFASNNPSFAFTYLYVANKLGYFLPQFKDKFEDIFFTEKPVVRNPSFTFGFEKAILFPALYITEKKLQYIDKLNKLSKGEPNLVIIKKKFMSFKRKMQEYKQKKIESRAMDIEAGVSLHSKKGGGTRARRISDKAKKAFEAKHPQMAKKAKSKKLPKSSKKPTSSTR